MTTTAPVTLHIDGVRLVTLTNQRGHWTARHRRNREQQAIVRAALVRLDRAALRAAPRLRVTLQRVIGKRGRPLDRDGLWSSMKHCIDAVAAHLGVDDGDGWWDWQVSPVQVRGADYGVKISFEVLPAAGEG
jgi:hypothetical protein